ncbi:pericentriolar material 1 protein-like isoform X4 [Patiria miniata]|uniref:Pericentriolar material 1 protein C-terminal domain-containing protein n=1 Tax=Patiria miniata TaxID=46514 RepID=A0A913ZXB2_PATMI|nr:pericentriolar material 1 protein-like isoform X4 [Patiria miniata]
MATGGSSMLRGVASEPRPRPSGSRINRPLGGVDDNFRFNWIGDKDEDRPNNYWDWKPSSTFAEPSMERRPAATGAVASGKKSKTKNKDREKTSSASPSTAAAVAAAHEPLPASPPSRESTRRHTPATFPRTRNVASARERVELELLRQQLTFSEMDEPSTDGQGVAANNVRRDVRSQSKRTAGQVNHVDEMPPPRGANRQRTQSGNDSSVNEMPDRNQIVARLMQIRDYMKQASSMLANLNTAPAHSDEQVGKLVQLQSHLQDQERAYLALLERMLSDEATGRSSHNSNESQSTSIAESASINIDAQSDISDATTEGTFTARTRPKIESQLGNYPSDVEYASGSEASFGREDDASSMSSRNSEFASAFGTMELHEQFSAMLRKYEEQGEQDEEPVALETVTKRLDDTEDEEELDSAMSTLTAHSADPVEENKDIQTRMEELEGLRQQHDLLKKMLQQQEELRALQNRQSALMKLQEDIEGRLRQSEDQNTDTASQSTLDVSAQSEPTEDQLQSQLAAFDYTQGGGADLSDQRRELLMKILSEDMARRAPEMQRARMLDRMDLAEREQSEVAAMNSEHEDLLSTLHALQQKKNHMDELLRQLQELRPSIPGATDTDSAMSAASSSHLLEHAQLQQGDEVREAQVVGSLDENEAMDKLRRLQEVRQRLDDLRDLVQQYQSLDGPTGALAGVDETGDARKTSSSVNFEDPELMTNLRRLERGEPVGRFQMNQGLQVQLDTAEDGTSTQQSEDDSQLATTDTESNQSLMLAWGNDPEIRGKIEKLQAAKRKLKQLQDLVTMVQLQPEAAMGLPDDLAALAATLHDEADTSNAENEEEDDEDEDGDDGDEGEEEDTNVTTSEMSEEVPQVSQETREAYFEAKMQQQRRELGKLQEERQRLLSVQQQLRDLNKQLPRAPQVKATNTTRQNPSVAASASRQLAATHLEDVVTPNHETLIAEKLRHRRLQTELKLKQQELAALMDRVKRNNTGDMNSDSGSAQGDSNDNDLFRVSMRSADVTAAASWGGSTQQSDDDEDDAYPSDGIQQVEEEEEQEQSLAGTSSTYTIDAAYRQHVPRPNSFPGQAIRNNAPPTPVDLEALHGIRYPKWVSDPRLRASAAAAKRQQNLRAAEELMAEESGRSAAAAGAGPDSDRGFYQYQIQQLQQQLQNSINLSQSMMRDQQCMNNMLQSSMSGGFTGMQPPPSAHTPTFGSTTPTPTNSDPRLANLMNDYNMRLQHQQLQLNMNHAYNQLYQQQQEIQRFQTEPVNVSGGPYSFEGAGEPNSNNNRMNGVAGYDTGSFTPFASTSPYGSGLYPHGAGFPNSNPLDYTSPFSQMSEASRRRQRDYDAYARHRQEQDARQRDYHVPPNTAQGSVEQFDLNREANASIDYGRYPYAFAERAPQPSAEDQEDRLSQPYIPPLDIQRLLEKSEKRRHLAQQGSTSGPKPTNKKSNSKTGATKSKDSTQGTRPSSGKRQGPRPGLSSSLSGTAFLDIASVASSTMSMSSMPGDIERQMKLPDTQRSLLTTTSEMESDAGSEFSLFEALRESIYSEVATLISQNESRPHFLIELFRELQLLNSDYLRQRALYSLQDLVSKFLTEETVHVPKGPVMGNAQTVRQQQQQQDPSSLWQMSTTASEHTPSESMITSEEEEMKAQIYRTNPKKQTKKTAQLSLGSLDAEEYDYVESVGSASSMSTPPSFSQDFGFANDELGDTVIHLDKALQRMREYERLKAEAEAAAAISSDALASEDKAAVSNSEVTSNSSAQDVGSESSFSDLPYPRIDTRQLDLQIKSIMQEVIPYLKEHMDDVCSPQLLSYIRRLVLTLSKQRDDSREFVRFFNRQLGSILQDSLAKFSGRKMRECGEDLLVDISEILFNELAFFRLMQDLDTAGSKLRQEAGILGDEDDEEEEEEEEEGEEEGATGTETGTETGTAAEEEGSDEGSSSEGESDVSSSEEAAEPSAKAKPAAATQPAQKPSFDEAALETAMDIATSREEEELGKTRDDDLARKLEASDRDEDSESALSKDQVKIELSMSETNAITYLGSGEDDDEFDELSAKQDETITSIGAAAAQVEEDSQGAEPSAQPDSTEVDTPKSDGDTEGDQDKPEAEGDPQAQAPAPSSLPNGSMEADHDEVTIDDLPSKMTSLTEVNIETKASEEQAPSAVLQSIIDTIVSGEASLAGDPAALKEPPTANGPPVLPTGGGDATTEEAAQPQIQENGT